MKIFFYKTLLVAFAVFIVFKLTIGSLLKQAENLVYDNFSKEKIEKLKENLREQIIIAVEKDDFIKDEDAELINAFISKIKQARNTPKQFYKREKVYIFITAL